MTDSIRIFCSTAQRTRETLAQLNQTWRVKPEKIEFSDQLYDATVNTYWKLIEGSEEGITTIIFIGHNPTLSYFNAKLESDFFMSSKSDIRGIFSKNV